MQSWFDHGTQGAHAYPLAGLPHYRAAAWFQNSVASRLPVDAASGAIPAEGTDARGRSVFQPSIGLDHSKWFLAYPYGPRERFLAVGGFSDLNRNTKATRLAGKSHGRGGAVYATRHAAVLRFLYALQPLFEDTANFAHVHLGSALGADEAVHPALFLPDADGAHVHLPGMEGPVDVALPFVNPASAPDAASASGFPSPYVNRVRPGLQPCAASPFVSPACAARLSGTSSHLTKRLFATPAKADATDDNRGGDAADTGFEQTEKVMQDALFNMEYFDEATQPAPHTSSFVYPPSPSDQVLRSTAGRTSVRSSTPATLRASGGQSKVTERRLIAVIPSTIRYPGMLNSGAGTDAQVQSGATTLSHRRRSSESTQQLSFSEPDDDFGLSTQPLPFMDRSALQDNNHLLGTSVQQSGARGEKHKLDDLARDNPKRHKENTPHSPERSTRHIEYTSPHGGDLGTLLHGTTHSPEITTTTGHVHFGPDEVYQIDTDSEAEDANRPDASRVSYSPDNSEDPHVSGPDESRLRTPQSQSTATLVSPFLLGSPDTAATSAAPKATPGHFKAQPKPPTSQRDTLQEAMKTRDKRLANVRKEKGKREETKLHRMGLFKDD